MASQSKALAGVHYVRRPLSGNRSRWHVYAWRGGPRIMTADQVLRPNLTPAAVTAYNEAHEKPAAKNSDWQPKSFAELADAYVLSADYTRLRPGTKRNWRGWIEKAKKEFGEASLKVMEDKRTRGVIRKWRDGWRHSPRQADFAIQVLKRILSWGEDGGYITVNRASKFKPLYQADRSEIIWADDEIEKVASKMQPHVARAFRFAAWTGLTRKDLLELRWDQVTDHVIAAKRSKTSSSQLIPVFDETRALLEEFKKHGKPALTVITNRRGAPFTCRGFSIAVERARAEAGAAKGKHLHDLRGTFATRLMVHGIDDRAIDAMLGWQTGRSARIRLRYISRDAIAKAAIQQMRRSHIEPSVEATGS